MLYSAAAAKALTRYLGIVFVGAALFLPQAVQAQSQVNVTVCQAGGSNITITNPEAGAVVNQSTVDLEGIVSDATQIEVRIDGAYNNTIPLNAGQTDFAASLTLAAGTRTIEVEANDVCGVQNGTDTVVVTYQPDSTDDGDDDPDTSVDPGSNPGGGVTISGPDDFDTPGIPRDDQGTLDESPSATPTLPPFVSTISGALDFDDTARDGLLKAVLRFALFTTGFGLMFFAVPLLLWRKRLDSEDAATEAYIQGQSIAAYESISHTEVWAIRSAGAVMVVISLII